MLGKIVYEGNSVYEIDMECMMKKRLEQTEKKVNPINETVVNKKRVRYNQEKKRT